MLTRITLLWVLFAAAMGFLVGGSFVSAFFAPQIVEQQQASGEKSGGNAKSIEEQHQATEEAIAYYNKWLMFFTAALAFATVVLGFATIGLYFGGKNQLELSRAAEQRELRAYIGHMAVPFDSRLIEINGIASQVSGKVKYFDMNYGSTPALNVSMYIRVVPDQAPSVLDSELTEAERQMVVQIVHQQNVGRIIETPTATSVTDRFFFYGYVNYTDIFGDRWRHRFAFTYDPDRWRAGGEAFVAHGQYNDEQYLGRDPEQT